VSPATTKEPGHAAVITLRATQFIEHHQAQHLDNDQLVKRCCAHLVATTGITESAAASYTMHALADIQARHVPAYIDMSYSTSYVVRVVDPRTGNVYQLTASDVLQLAQAHNDTPPDRSHSIRQCGRRAAN